MRREAHPHNQFFGLAFVEHCDQPLPLVARDLCEPRLPADHLTKIVRKQRCGQIDEPRWPRQIARQLDLVESAIARQIGSFGSRSCAFLRSYSSIALMALTFSARH